MNDTDPKAIGQHLSTVAEGDDSPQELAFDPGTGELRLVPRNRPPSPDAVVIDQIAEDGFFQE